MAYNTSNRSERLLQGRRFTTDNLSLTQEAFTDVFDLGAGEIFTDDGLIPTGSSQLAYSGSAQDGAIVSGSVVNPSIETDVNVLKFHYRHKMKQAADGQREVYYFTTSEPSAVSDTVTSDQLIETDQQTNFISPKYIIASDSPNNTESSTPGYKVVVYKDTASDADSITSSPADPSHYVFDFKTGVLTWVSNAPSSTQYVYITVYQYIGRTLRSQIDDGSIGGSGGSTDISALNTFTGSIDGEVTALMAATSSYAASSTVTALDGEVTALMAATSSYLTESPAGTISGSQQITDFGFISESYSTAGTNIISGSAQTLAHLVGQDVVVNTITAETYIVSSSVSHITQSFSSGSTIFGDDITDTHQMTGSLFVSGSISFSEIDGGSF